MHPIISLLGLATFASIPSAVFSKPFYNPALATELMRRTAPSSVNSGQFNDCLNPENVAKGDRVQTCKPKNTLDASGNCGPLVPQGDANLEAAFCQVDVRWDYGPEVPFDASCECSDASCRIENTESTTVTDTYGFSVGGNAKRDLLNPLEERDGGLSSLKASDLVNVFNAGASWSYSTSYTNASAATNTKPAVAANKCGYWTFVPYFVTICGTITWVTTGYSSTGPIDTSDVTSQGGWCQEIPYTDGNGSPMGETIFVARNCDMHWPLGFCWQDPTYLNYGVSQNASVYQDFVDAHENFDITKTVESTPLIDCEENTGPYSEGNIPPGCAGGLPSGVPLSSAYDAPSKI